MKACSAGNVARIRMDKQKRVQRDVQFLPYPALAISRISRANIGNAFPGRKIFAAAEEESQNSHFHQLSRSRLRLLEV